MDASIGIALAPDDGDDVEQLVRRADVAMYVAKQARAGVLRYDPPATATTRGKLVLMASSARAVERGELERPLPADRRHDDRRVEQGRGARPLAAPDEGMLQPGAFIPLAEHTGS